MKPRGRDPARTPSDSGYYSTPALSKTRETGGGNPIDKKNGARILTDAGDRLVLFAVCTVSALAFALFLLFYGLTAPENGGNADRVPYAKNGTSLEPLSPAADGKRTAETPESPDAIPVFLSVGDIGQKVRMLDGYLGTLGYDAGTPGNVYTARTARAVAEFQRDCGMEANGICSDALFLLLRQKSQQLRARALQPLSGDAGVSVLSGIRETDTSVQTLADALRNNGCDPAEYGLRGALLLFQRTHGLCGTGEPGTATLRALGISAGDEENAGDAERAAAERELEIALAARYLQNAAAAEPALADLHTLTGIAHVLINRKASKRFPDSMSILCSQGLQTGTTGGASLYPLCLRAAEQAFLESERGCDPTCGALYYCLRGEERDMKEHLRTAAAGRLVFWK